MFNLRLLYTNELPITGGSPESRPADGERGGGHETSRGVPWSGSLTPGIQGRPGQVPGRTQHSSL